MHVVVLLENILSLQRNFESGPSWFEAYSTLYEHWLARNEN